MPAMTSPELSPLGKAVDYGQAYDPSLLFPIARASQRALLGLGDELPFVGVDFWNALLQSGPRLSPKLLLTLAQKRAEYRPQVSPAR